MPLKKPSCMFSCTFHTNTNDNNNNNNDNTIIVVIVITMNTTIVMIIIIIIVTRAPRGHVRRLAAVAAAVPAREDHLLGQRKRAYY